MAPCPVTKGITVPPHSARTKPLPLLRYVGRSTPLVSSQRVVANAREVRSTYVSSGEASLFRRK